MTRQATPRCCRRLFHSSWPLNRIVEKDTVQSVLIDFNESNQINYLGVHTECFQLRFAIVNNDIGVNEFGTFEDHADVLLRPIRIVRVGHRALGDTSQWHEWMSRRSCCLLLQDRRSEFIEDRI
jgi:hypothetical protein